MAILIIDFDGTIHDSMCIYAPAVRACHDMLAEQGLMAPGEVPDALIRGYLGLTALEMWKEFAPSLSEEQQQEGSRYIGREMARLAMQGEAKLYDGAIQALAALKQQGHRLVFLSNCSKGYMDMHTRVFHLDRYFDEMYCSEQFDWEEKWMIVRKLIPEWKSRFGDIPIMVIGDRYKDMEIARAISPEQNGGEETPVRKIFCSYGFGDPEEGKDADITAKSVRVLPDCVSRLLDQSSTTTIRSPGAMVLG